MVKWKKSKSKLNPDIIFEHIAENRRKTDRGAALPAFSHHEYKVILSTMLDFGDEISQGQKENIVSAGIQACADGDSNAKTFLETVNERYRQNVAKKEEVFRLITTISVSNLPPLPKMKIEGCEVEFCRDKRHIKLIQARFKFLKGHRVEDPDLIGTTRVVVTTKSKSAEAAAEKCLNSLNLLRSAMCATLNSGVTISFGGSEFKPINKVRLGKYHTVHDKAGKPATELYWFEPQYTKDRLVLDSKQHERIRDWIRTFFRQLNKLKFNKLVNGPLHADLSGKVAGNPSSS